MIWNLGMAALRASRCSAISYIASWKKNLSKKERRKIICASRWSAVGYRHGTAQKKCLTETGLLMEVADDSPGVGVGRSVNRAFCVRVDCR